MCDDLHSEVLKPLLGDELESVDVLTAGFPCQPFSVAGLKKGFEDDRGTLFLHIIRLIHEFGAAKPKVLFLENVSNFLGHDEGRTFRRVQHEIQHAGYWFTTANAEIVNTATHSTIPQNRSRIFMVAMSCDHFSRNTFTFPSKVAKTELQSLWSFISRRKKVDNWYYFSEDSQYHRPFVEAVEEFGSDSIYQLRRNYVRENKSNLCFTLMANMGEGGHNQPVIKDRWGIRKLTEIECARLQGFSDDWFEFPDDVPLYQRYKQIGNSVTVPLVRRMAEQIIKLVATAKS
ncbi:MAG: DNA (cytosine-5-)-methyltransferase [Planctomycetota bacterium]